MLFYPNATEYNKPHRDWKMAVGVVLSDCFLPHQRYAAWDAAIKSEGEPSAEPESVFLLNEHFLIVTKICKKTEHMDILCIFNCICLLQVVIEILG